MKKHYSIGIFLLVFTFTFLCASNSFSQTAEEGAAVIKPTSSTMFSLGGDLVSRYIWRGKDYGNSPSIQPNASFSVAGFKIGVWGSYGFVPYSQQINDTTTVDMGNYAEFDPYVSFTFKGFTLCVTDYFFPNGMTPNNVKYFDYKKATTGHLIEVSLAWNGPEKFPLSVYAGTMVYGPDKNKDDEGTVGMGNDNNYSTYFEVAYPFTIKGIGVKPFIGGIPFGSGIYGPTGGVVNTGLTLSKTIPVTEKFGIPVYTSIIANPQSESVFFVFGITL